MPFESYQERVDRFLSRNKNLRVAYSFERDYFSCSFFYGPILKAQGISIHSIAKAVQNCCTNFQRMIDPDLRQKEMFDEPSNLDTKVG